MISRKRSFRQALNWRMMDCALVSDL
jgi:hypothetical protein